MDVFFLLKLCNDQTFKKKSAKFIFWCRGPMRPCIKKDIIEFLKKMKKKLLEKF